MFLSQGSGRHAFADALNRVYDESHFDVRETGQPTRLVPFRVHQAKADVLKPVTVFSHAFCTTRPAHRQDGRWAGHVFIMHQHRGRIRLRFDNDAPVILRPNDVLLMNPFHTCELMSQHANEVSVTPIPVDFIGKEEVALAACGQRLDCGGVAGSVLGSALTALETRPYTAGSDDEHLLYEVLRQLLPRVVTMAREPDRSDAPAGNDIMERARRFALSDLANPDLSPGAIAASMGVSRRYLYRAFAEYGVTPASWLWSLRVEQAHIRLTSHHRHTHSLTQVAFEVGFNDMAHFSRAYRARFGCTPNQARQAALAAG